MLQTTISTGLNNLFAVEREDHAREQNHKYNEQSANNSDKRTRQLYEDLYSSKAQMEQLKEAGLSPSIFASGGLAGSSGQSGAQGSGAHGIGPNVFGVDPLAASQIQLNQAQARNLNAEADTIEGKNPRGEAEISQIFTEIGLKNAQTANTNAQTEFQKLVNYIKDATAETEIETIVQNCQTAMNLQYKTYYEWQREKTALALDEATFNDKCTIVEREGKLLLEKIFSERQGRKLDAALTQQAKQNCQNMAYEMKLAYSKYWQDQQKLQLELIRIKSDWYTNMKKLNLEAALGSQEAAQGWIDTMFKAYGNFMSAGYMGAGNNSMTTNAPKWSWDISQ